jgi:hypothetical protein
LLHLDAAIIEEEVHKIIMENPKEKALGLDGFIALFFVLCWDIIKEDIMRAVKHFFSMNHQDLHLLNQAFTMLIPKKSYPEKVTIDLSV